MFRLDATTAQALGLVEDLPVDATLLTRITEADARQQARTIALRLLDRRLRSRAELEAALRRRGLPREAVVAVVGDLRRAGWVDDTQFARAWVRDRLALRPCGPRRLRSELMAKGVAAQVADEAITALLPPAMEDELALASARSRLRRLRGLEPAVAHRRLMGWLQRRGHAPGVIVRVLQTLRPELLDGTDVDPAA